MILRFLSTLQKSAKKGISGFKVKASEPDFYQLGFSTSDFITLLAEPGEKIKLEFEGKNLFEKYSVKGSAGSEKITDTRSYSC